MLCPRSFLAIVTLTPFVTAQDLPVIEVVKDNTVITTSCRVRIAPGIIIADSDNNGVLHIKNPTADAGGAESQELIIEFEPGTILRGAEESLAPEKMAGTGIRIDGIDRVWLREVNISGFKVGVHASDADGLAINSANISSMWRQRLRSTRQREDPADWLWPHANDAGEWRTNYGAAVYIERSKDVTITKLKVRQCQNGVVLDRVENAKVYDNDCSFLSGWGFALWRSSHNILSRNAADFCIRGHSDGVYNRGQDSAGILAFEQCNNNIFIENSATHGGDGFFGFAGKESLGEVNPGAFVPANVGCNDNTLIENDFSFASAHGIEMTFSRGNKFIHNRLVSNGICGIWAGYSSKSVIANNYFEGNGRYGYGHEGGAVNIEHGSHNHIHDNSFIDNSVGVHLWWDDDGTLLTLPGVKAHHIGVRDNIISSNRFELNDLSKFSSTKRIYSAPFSAVRLRDTGPTAETPRVSGTILASNLFKITAPGAVERDISPLNVSHTPTLTTDAPVPTVYPTQRAPLGETSPVGSRRKLSGTHNIIIGDYDPWDHQAPMVVTHTRTGPVHVYEVLGLTPEEITIECDQITQMLALDNPLRTRIEIRPLRQQSAVPYTFTVRGTNLQETRSGVLMVASWECAAFPWGTDPRENDAKWRVDRLKVPQAVVTVPELNFDFGTKGPKGHPLFAPQVGVAPGPTNFGMVCVSTINLPAGSWRFTTRSDDGVRVVLRTFEDDAVKMQTLLENWTHHAPTTDTAILKLVRPTEVNVEVQYFQLDGYATLALEVSAEDDANASGQ
jgi:parallel beta-helix repeat protein